MPTPDPTATTTPPPKLAVEWPCPAEWTEEDLAALDASETWFSYHCTREMVEPYLGMHVAIIGERIVDGHPNFEELGRRLEAMADAGTISLRRILFRYIPTDEESMRRGYY